MKKLLYLLAFVTIMFASCDPMSNTYKSLDANPTPSTLSFGTTTTYTSFDAAKTGIASLLNTKYANYPDQSKATVSFPLAGTFTLAADNVLAHLAYTLVTADYNLVTTFTDFTDANMLTYLSVKYPTPAANQVAVLTYNYYLSGATASSGTPVTDTFIYLNGAWIKAYTVSAAQYTSVNRGVNFYFTSADLTYLPAYLISFLNADPSVMAVAKAGDVKYVTYKTSATTIQLFPLVFNGTSWANNFPLNFLKLNGTWLPDPTVYITELDTTNYGNPDYQYLNTLTTIGNATNRGNVAQYGDFNVQSTSSYYWSDSDIAAALAAILLHRIPSPVVGIPYTVNYFVYTGSTLAASKTFIYNGTAFIPQ